MASGGPKVDNREGGNRKGRRRGSLQMRRLKLPRIIGAQRFLPERSDQALPLGEGWEGVEGSENY